MGGGTATWAVAVAALLRLASASDAPPAAQPGAPQPHERVAARPPPAVVATLSDPHVFRSASAISPARSPGAYRRWSIALGATETQTSTLRTDERRVAEFGPEFGVDYAGTSSPLVDDSDTYGSAEETAVTARRVSPHGAPSRDSPDVFVPADDSPVRDSQPRSTDRSAVVEALDYGNRSPAEQRRGPAAAPPDRRISNRAPPGDLPAFARAVAWRAEHGPPVAAAVFILLVLLHALLRALVDGTL